VSAADQRLITAILPDDVDTVGLAAALQRETGIVTTFRHNARGVGRTTRRLGRAPLIPERRNVFFVVVDSARADSVFAWLLEAARVDRYGGGLVFERRLRQTQLPRQE